jgi:hypothetical protein
VLGRLVRVELLGTEEKIEYLEKHGENETSANGTNGPRDSSATNSTAVAT